MADPAAGAAVAPALERVTRYDDNLCVRPAGGWPVEVPPFRAEDFRGLNHRALFLAMRAAQRGSLALPAPLRDGLIRVVAALGRTFDRRHTRAAETYVRAALPEATDDEVRRLVRQAWRHLLRVALVSEGVEKHVLGHRMGDHFSVHATPAARDLLAAKEPAIFVTAHAGYWEACAAGMVAMELPPGYAIGKAPRNDFAAVYLQRNRELQGMKLIPRYGAMSAVPAAIRAGAVVGMLLDHRPRQKPVYAEFFGRRAACDRSAGVLLRRVKAPLVFYGCYAADGEDPLRTWRFDLRFTRVIRPEELEGLDPVGIAQLVNRELEKLILHRPDEVFWLHDRFKRAADDPEGPA